MFGADGIASQGDRLRADGNAGPGGMGRPGFHDKPSHLRKAVAAFVVQLSPVDTTCFATRAKAVASPFVHPQAQALNLQASTS